MSRFSLFQPHLALYLKTPVLISFLISSVITLAFLIAYFTMQPVFPLFYSLPQPQDYLVPKIWLIVFPLISFTISLTHLAFLKTIRLYEKIIQQLYVWVTVLMQILLLLALARILWIIN